MFLLSRKMLPEIGFSVFSISLKMVCFVEEESPTKLTNFLCSILRLKFESFGEFFPSVETSKKYKLNVESSIGCSVGGSSANFNDSNSLKMLSIVPKSEKISKNEIRFCAESVRYGVKIK